MAEYSDNELANMINCYAELREKVKTYQACSKGSIGELQLAEAILDSLLPTCRNRIPEPIKRSLDFLKDNGNSLEAACQEVIDNFRGV